MNNPKQCETCPRRNKVIPEHVLASDWLRYSIQPGLAHSLLVRIAEVEELMPQQFPITDERFIEGIIDSTEGPREAREAIAVCFARHASGECTESLLYKYVTADFNL